MNSINPADVYIYSPAEDFNIYRIIYRGRIFSIYEGNNPEQEGDLIRLVNLDIDAQRSAIYRNKDQIILMVELKTLIWPAYLIISTTCPGANECEIEKFGDLLSLRTDDTGE